MGKVPWDPTCTTRPMHSVAEVAQPRGGTAQHAAL
jgi:hypothetical protein